MFVRSANLNQIFTKCRHTGTVISSVQYIESVPKSSGFTVRPIYTSLADNLFDARIIKRVESPIVVTHLIHMEDYLPALFKRLDDRRQKIADGLAAAEKGKADLAQAQARVSLMEAASKTENHARLAEAEKQASALIDEARREAEAEKARIVAQARQDAAQEVQRARETLRAEVAVLAVKGAEQILRREVDAKAHAELLDQLQAQL